MLGNNLYFKNFNLKKFSLSKKKTFLKKLNKLLEEDKKILASLNNDYKDSYNKKLILRLKKKKLKLQ